MEKVEEERKYKLSFRFIPIRRERENTKEIAKKFNELKDTVMASFQAKIGWKKPRK